MRIESIPAFARKLMRPHGMNNQIKFHSYPHKPITMVGVAHHIMINGLWHPSHISVSYDWCKVLDEDEVERLILHEAAHLLVPYGSKHNDLWAAKCVELGIEPVEKWKSRKLPDIITRQGWSYA